MKVPSSHVYTVPLHMLPIASTASSIVRPPQALPTPLPPGPGKGLQLPKFVANVQ